MTQSGVPVEPSPPVDLRESPVEPAVQPAAESPAPRASTSTLLERALLPHTVRTLIAATTAWGVTVAPAAFARSSSLAPRLTAFAALFLALAGPLVRPRRVGRHVGITAFVSLAAIVWLTSSTAIQPARVDLGRAALGSIAWSLFALSWSDPWKRPEKSEEVSEPHGLEARSRLPHLAVPITAIGLLGGLACIVLAWRVDDAGRALLGHAAALAAAVGLVSASSVVATSRGDARRNEGQRLSPVATRTLALLVAVALGGAVVFALR